MFINTDSKFIWMNGEFLKWDETKVHALTHTLHYGVGVFEGVRAYKNDLGGAIFNWKFFYPCTISTYRPTCFCLPPVIYYWSI